MPYVTQSTIKFGVRIPPEKVGDPVIRRLLRIYHGWLALVTIGIFTSFIIIPDLYGVYKIGTFSYIAEIAAVYLIYFVFLANLLSFPESFFKWRADPVPTDWSRERRSALCSLTSLILSPE